MIKIDLQEYILNKIGHTDWIGDETYDAVSYCNLITLENYLIEIENIRDALKEKLYEHCIYNERYASAKKLHDKAQEIDCRHCLNEDRW